MIGYCSWGQINEINPCCHVSILGYSENWVLVSKREKIIAKSKFFSNLSVNNLFEIWNPSLNLHQTWYNCAWPHFGKCINRLCHLAMSKKSFFAEKSQKSVLCPTLDPLGLSLIPITTKTGTDVEHWVTFINALANFCDFISFFKWSDMPKMAKISFRLPSLGDSGLTPSQTATTKTNAWKVEEKRTLVRLVIYQW